MTKISAPQLIIFDFDGVIADSETLANTVLAETVTKLGLPTALDDALTHYMGKRFHEVMAAIETKLGKPLPDNFAADFQKRTLNRFEQELKIIDGVRDYIREFSFLPHCIASSSSPDRLSLCLKTIKLADHFGPHVFSAALVEKGKPHPDIFLYAAKQMQTGTQRAIIIEDSASGVEAGVAAGATVIGFTGASHIRNGHEERLRSAGAHHIAPTFAQVAHITRSLLG